MNIETLFATLECLNKEIIKHEEGSPTYKLIAEQRERLVNLIIDVTAQLLAMNY